MSLSKFLCRYINHIENVIHLTSLQFWVISKITFHQTAIQPFSAKSCLDRSSLPGGLHVRGEAKVIVKKMHLYIPSPEIYTLHKLAITESKHTKEILIPEYQYRRQLISALREA